MEKRIEVGDTVQFTSKTRVKVTKIDDDLVYFDKLFLALDPLKKAIEKNVYYLIKANHEHLKD